MNMNMNNQQIAIADIENIKPKISLLLEEYSQDKSFLTNILNNINANQTRRELFRDIFKPTRYHLNVEDVIKGLDAKYWRVVMEDSKLLEIMPTVLKDKWWHAISEHETITFNLQNVFSTLDELFSNTTRFFAEKVDGVFKVLSRSHVTNTPEGFNKRIIIDYMIEKWGSLNYDRIRYIDDLLMVIQQINGKTQSRCAERILRECQKNYGEWIIYRNILKIKLYKKGTVHIELNPDVARILNLELSKLYPNALYNGDRNKSKIKEVKEYPLENELIHHDILIELSKIQSRQNSYYAENKDTIKILKYLGAVENQDVKGTYHIDNVVLDNIRSTLILGYIPESKSHQFYPTPKSIVETMLNHISYDEKTTILEPSAGTGSIVDQLKITNKQNVTCIDINKLHTDILKNKGYYNSICHNFLNYNEPHQQFDLILMNPPYTGKQWETHVKHAYKFLKEGGTLLAVLPNINKNTVLINDKEQFLEVFHNAFEDTNITTVLYKVTK